jgi:serine/threonine protein kinase
MFQLGRYELQQLIGRGGMGEVYRAYDTLLGRTVAIKVFRTAEGVTPAEAASQRQRLLREAQAAARLTHPNIVSVFDYAEEADVAYIVMELIEGETLDALLARQRTPLAPGEIFRIVTAAARALDYAHSHGVVHRDIKPANIMLLPGGDVRIADFGIAKFSGASALTMTGMVMGTPHYMAPEQLMAQTLGGHIDQFALAAVAYTMLTGRKPFEADTLTSLVTQILHSEPPPASTQNPLLTSGIDAVLRKGMAKNPAERFKDCSAFAGALEAAFSPAKPAKSLKPLIWLGVAALLLVSLGTAGFLSIQHFREQKPEQAVRPREAVRPPAPIAKGEPVPAPSAAPQKSAAPSSSVGINSVDGLRYVRVPAGSFDIGCVDRDQLCSDDEKPRHTVNIPTAFWMTRAEVSVAAYRRFAAAKKRPLPAPPASNPAWSDGAQPVVSVVWQDAQDYCGWAGGRLPTEAEWEYASRAGDIKALPDNLDARAWHGANSGGLLHPVAGKAPNAWGLYDVQGNVWEWCSDWFDPKYYKVSPREVPQGPARGSGRVIRGGASNSDARYLRYSERTSSDPSKANSVVGFRCVLASLR